MARLIRKIFWLLLLPGWVHADEITAKNCKVTFETRGEPILIKILGKSEIDCTGKAQIEGGKITKSEFVLDLNKLDTGIPLRNRHLRENYLEVEKFPRATLRLNQLQELEAQRAGKQKNFSKFEADLDLHGNTASIEDGTYSITGNKVTSKFAVDLPKWKVQMPSFMGVKIVDKVYLTISFEM